jgi:hypothetical protein
MVESPIANVTQRACGLTRLPQTPSAGRSHGAGGDAANEEIEGGRRVAHQLDGNMGRADQKAVMPPSLDRRTVSAALAALFTTAGASTPVALEAILKPPGGLPMASAGLIARRRRLGSVKVCRRRGLWGRGPAAVRPGHAVPGGLGLEDDRDIGLRSAGDEDRVRPRRRRLRAAGLSAATSGLARRGHHLTDAAHSTPADFATGRPIPCRLVIG